MHGSNCHNKKCLLNTGKLDTYSRCSHPNQKMFMMCEAPSNLQIDNILKRLKETT